MCISPCVSESVSLAESLLCFSVCLCLSVFFMIPGHTHQAFALLPWAPPYLSSPTLFPVALDKGLSMPSPGGGVYGQRKDPGGDGGVWAA